MLQEVCFLIGREDVVLWSDAGGSPVALPDSRARWLAIWRFAQSGDLVEIAHSHPRGGAWFSSVDESTMRGLQRALGKQLRFSVITPTTMLVREAGETHSGHMLPRSDEPWWADLLRRASGCFSQPRRRAVARLN